MDSKTTLLDVGSDRCHRTSKDDDRSNEPIPCPILQASCTTESRPDVVAHRRNILGGKHRHPARDDRISWMRSEGNLVRNLSSLSLRSVATVPFPKVGSKNVVLKKKRIRFHPRSNRHHLRFLFFIQTPSWWERRRSRIEWETHFDPPPSFLSLSTRMDGEVVDPFSSSC